MSGGSLNYISCKVEDIAETIEGRRPRNYRLRAFAAHLKKVATALHDIEWDFSGDSSLGEEEIKNIDEIIGPRAEIDCAIEDAKRIRDDLDTLIKKVS